MNEERADVALDADWARGPLPRVSAQWADAWFKIAPFVSAAALIDLFPTPLGVLVALAALIVTAALGDHLRRALERRGVMLGPSPLEAARCRSRAKPGHHSPNVDRVIGWSELGMGGPTIEDWLLADGAVVNGIFEGWIDAGPRYRVARFSAPEGLRVIVYDSDRHIIHRCVGEGGLAKVDQLCRAGTRRRQRLVSTLLARSDAISLLPAFGIWLAIDGRPDVEIETRAADGTRLTGRLQLPPDLRCVDRPDDFVRRPRYALAENGADTCLSCSTLASVVSSGTSIALRGFILDRWLRIAESVWHLRVGGRWASVAAAASGPREENGRATLYFLDSPSIDETGRATFAIAGQSFTASGVVREKPASDSVSLEVSWRSTPLKPRVVDGMISVRIHRD